MRKTMSFILFLFAFSAQAFAPVDFSAYVGPATYILDGKVVQRPAAVEQDRLTVPNYGKMDRYILRHYIGRPDIALFTIYKDESGNLYSYFWDTAYLRTERHFADPSELKYKFNANSWVQLENRNGVYHGVFYPGDSSEVEFAIEVEPTALQLTTREKASGGILSSIFSRSITHTHRFEVIR